MKTTYFFKDKNVIVLLITVMLLIAVVCSACSADNGPWNMQCEIAGKTIQLPCSYSVMSEKGYSTAEENTELPLKKGSQAKINLYITENEYFTGTLVNDEKETKQYKECTITGITVDTHYCPDFVFGNTITAKSTIKDIEELFGTCKNPTHYDLDKKTKATVYSYTKGEKTYQFVLVDDQLSKIEMY